MSSRSFRMSCLTSIKWIPVLFILAVVGWSYYAYVGQMCIVSIQTINKRIIYLFIYHVLLSLFLWSYLRTVLTKSLIPSSIFYMNEIDGENLASVNTLEERRAMLVRLARQTGLQLLTRHFDGSIRYCFTCRCIKPDRAHHCSLCGRCVLRYDHHCPWTNSCISYGNYKYFVLFLAYTFLFCFFVAGTSFEYFLLFWQGIADIKPDETKTESSNGKFHLLFLFFVSIMFGISVSSLLFYHLYLTAKNRTTLESFRVPIFATGPEKNGFNLGYKRNFQEIFGENIFKALLPIPTTPGDGIHYQINYDLINGSHQTNASAMTLLGTNSQVNNNQSNHSALHQSNDFLVAIDPYSNTSNTENQNIRLNIQNSNDAQ